MVCSAALSPRRSACTVPKRSTSATVTNGSLSAWHFASAADTAFADAPTEIRFCWTTFSGTGWTSAAGTAAGAAPGPAFAVTVATAVSASAPAAAAANTFDDFFMVFSLWSKPSHGSAPGYSPILSRAREQGIGPLAAASCSERPAVSAKRLRDGQGRGAIAWEVAVPHSNREFPCLPEPPHPTPRPHRTP